MVSVRIPLSYMYVCLYSALSWCLFYPMATFEHVQNLAMDATDKSYSVFICFVLKLCVLYTFCMDIVRYVSVLVPFISDDVG